MKRFTQSLLALTFGGALFYLALSRFDLRRTSTALGQARPGFLLAAIGLIVLGYLLRGARWRIWERGLTYWNSFRIILIGFMGNNILPARLGEILRAHCAAAKTGCDRGRTAALASVAAERVLDGLILSVFGFIAIFSVPMDRRFQGAVFLLSFVFAVIGAVLAIGIYAHGRIRSLVAVANRKFPGHVTAYAKIKTNHFLDGLLPLGTLRRTLAAIASTATIWGLEVAACYLFGRAIWSGMNAGIAVLFLVVVNFLSLVPFTMGGIGTIDAVAPLFLIGAGVPSYVALAMVVSQHAAQYLFTTITGGIFYFGGGFHSISLTNPKGASFPSSETVSPVTVVEDARSILDELSMSVHLKPAPREDVHLSIVIPAYNEQSRLPRTVLETIRWCSARDLDFELIICDDGSSDETLALGRLFEESDHRVYTLACPHMGKGATVRMGVLNARGRRILFMDADGATPLDELPKLESALDDGYDIAIGSRVMQHPGEIEVKTSLHRRIIGRGFAFLVNLFAFYGIADTQCGFKMFRREAATAIFSRQRIRGFAFDVEILFIAKRLSFSIAEIPVNWVAQPNSKVNVVTDSLKMFWDLSHIRWVHRNCAAKPSLAREKQLVG